MTDTGMNVDLEILRAFVAESLGSLDDVSAKLVFLEKSPNDTAAVDTVFRVLHSIKGSCGFFDLMAVKTVSHRMESVLSAVKGGRLPVAAALISELLTGVDYLKLMLEQVQENPVPQPLSPVHEAYLGRLDVLLTLQKDAVVAAEAPKAPEPSLAASGAEGHDKHAIKSMRIDEATIDGFMAYTSELISASEMFRYLQSKLEGTQLSPELRREFRDAILSFHGLSQNLQRSLMEIRKLPLKTLFSKVPRLVRDLSLSLSKEASVQVEGDELRVDKSLLEVLDDPLVHMIRNSLDHGIERPAVREAAGKPKAGTVTVRGSVDESFLYLTIEDDGAGIDPVKMRAIAVKKGLLTEERAAALSDQEALNLRCAPGFSSAEQVTDVSGRGVGMDVVMTNITRANGKVTVESAAGKGTRIQIRVPLSITTLVLDGLIIKVGDEKLVIPLEDVKGVEGAEGQAVTTIRGRHATVQFRGRTIPLVSLPKILG